MSTTTPSSDLDKRTSDTRFIHNLLDKGANVQIVNLQGQTPLKIACSNRNAEVVRMLLDASARWVPIISRMHISNVCVSDHLFRCQITLLQVH